MGKKSRRGQKRQWTWWWCGERGNHTAAVAVLRLQSWTVPLVLTSSQKFPDTSYTPLDSAAGVWPEYKYFSFSTSTFCAVSQVRKIFNKGIRKDLSQNKQANSLSQLPPLLANDRNGESNSISIVAKNNIRSFLDFQIEWINQKSVWCLRNFFIILLINWYCFPSLQNWVEPAAFRLGRPHFKLPMSEANLNYT